MSSGLVNNACVFRAHPVEMDKPNTTKNAEILQKELIRILILSLPNSVLEKSSPNKAVIE
jgi:hypothetical protein